MKPDRRGVLAAVLVVLMLGVGALAADEPVLKKGDRLALIGDSITHQRMYSLLVNLYLTACRPELDVTVSQCAVYGENAGRFLRRMDSTCLGLYRPTIVTTMYGTNDSNLAGGDVRKAGELFARNTRAYLDRFKDAGVRVVLGTPGVVRPDPNGKRPKWNDDLSHMRDVLREIAEERKLPFVDVHQAMLTAKKRMKKRTGKPYDIVGKDGLHPSWHGQTAIAVAFLRGLGLGSEPLARIEYDMAAGKGGAGEGHEIVSADVGSVTVRSSRYPFMFYWDHPGDLGEMAKIADAMGFFDDLNRFILVVRTPEAGDYEVTWGNRKRTFSSTVLANGVNLAREFHRTPFHGRTRAIWTRINMVYDIDSALIARVSSNGKSTRLAGMADRIRAKVVTEADGEVDVEGLIKSNPMKLRDMAQRNMKAEHQPVVHTIKVTKVADSAPAPSAR